MSINFCAKTADFEEADDLLRRVAEAARNVFGERLFPDREPTLRDPDDVEEAPGTPTSLDGGNHGRQRLDHRTAGSSPCVPSTSHCRTRGRKGERAKRIDTALPNARRDRDRFRGRASQRARPPSNCGLAAWAYRGMLTKKMMLRRPRRHRPVWPSTGSFRIWQR